jgi:hypothetical protein
VAVDHDRTRADAEEIGDGRVLIELVGLRLAEPRAGVFDHAGAFADGCGGVAAGGMDGGGANDQTHRFLGRKVLPSIEALSGSCRVLLS